MNERFSIVVAMLALLCFGCDGGPSRAGPEKNRGWTNGEFSMRRKEIVSPNVLSVQLATHSEIESRTRFTRDEPVDASLFLTNSEHVETRRISASLECGDAVIEEQSIWVEPEENRTEFDFRFAETNRPPGECQIRFVEIARSRGKPVLLAKLFLTIE